MAWMFEKSPAWRRLVAKTRESPAFYAAFAAGCFIVPYALGQVVMWGTNPEADAKWEEKLRRRQTIDHKVMARANKERLAVLFEELQDKSSGEARYAAALDGQSLGTHARGTTTGALSIQQRQKQPEGRPPER